MTRTYVKEVLFYSVSVAEINSNGVLNFSQPQEHPFMNTQVPPETYKTGISMTNTAINITPTTTIKKPDRETKGKC